MLPQADIDHINKACRDFGRYVVMVSLRETRGHYRQVSQIRDGFVRFFNSGQAEWLRVEDVDRDDFILSVPVGLWPVEEE